MIITGIPEFQNSGSFRKSGMSMLLNVPNLICVAQLLQKLRGFDLKFKLPVVELAPHRCDITPVQVSADFSLNSKEELIAFEIFEL